MLGGGTSTDNVQCSILKPNLRHTALICNITAAIRCISHCIAAHRNVALENKMVVLQDKVHPQTIAVLQSRADGLGLTVEVGDETKFNVDKDVSGVLVQYPATDGTVHDYKVCPDTLHYTSAGSPPFTAMLIIIINMRSIIISHAVLPKTVKLILSCPKLLSNNI